MIKAAFHRFKKLFLVLGMAAMIVAGYTTVSVVTSCKAEAQCICSVCTPFGSATAAFTSVFAGAVTQAIVVFSASILTYFGIAAVAYASAVVEKANEVNSNMRDWFDTFWNYNLLPAMGSQTEQLTTMDTNQTLAMGRFADALNMNRTIRKMKEMQAETHREVRPGENACVAATITGGMTRAAQFRRAYNAAAPADMLPRSGNATGTTSAQGNAAEQKARWQNYITNYCQRDYNAGKSGCTADATYVNRDLDVTGEIFVHDTIDLKQPVVKKILDDLVTNIAEPVVKDNVFRSALTKSEGQEALLKGESYKAKRQVVHDAIYHIIARRAPGSSTAMANFVRPMRQAAGIPNSQISPNPSHNEIMEAMMSERFRTGKYSLEQIDEPQNNNREMVIQQAFQAMQLSDQLDLLDRYALVLAAQAGDEVRAAKPFDDDLESKPLR